MLASANNIPVRQKAAIVDGINLACDSFFEKAVLVELMVKVLGNLVILRRVRPAERIEGESKLLSELLLNRMHFRAVFRNRQPGLVGGQFRRRTVLIRRADEENLVPAGSMEPSAGIRRKHRANKIAQMLDPIDVGQRGRDQDAGHDVSRNGEKARLIG
jgi:hypothetical protein